MPTNDVTTVCIYLLMEEIFHQHLILMVVAYRVMLKMRSRKRKRASNATTFRMIERIPDQNTHMNRLVGVSDFDCLANLRMDRNTFGRLCILLRDMGGLTNGRYIEVEEQVAMFLSVLAHHKKNRVVKFDFWRSGQTVSKFVHLVLKAILKLHTILLVKPAPVPDDSTNNTWCWFKGCLGALDGSYINLMVSNVDKPKYRTRKGQIATNTLAVCDRNMQFVYVLPGWEGSAADLRILRDALQRANGFRVPKGNYYLCDNGYANSEGFLAPYKGIRYHLKEWGPAANRPQNAMELFNLRHSKARNVIERAFGIMKMRRGILRSSTFYPVKTQIRLIMACFILNNFIRSEMPDDPIEREFDTAPGNDQAGVEIDGDFIDSIESSPQWNAERDALAQAMWLSYITNN
ncbi:uncharacterized protein LOC131025265 [Salvia miltiorrhiza]|uniref:uncharacterized protein LOC131025265 n=1 Tax=Salvia miltiorrhiza TaxID=226208 RepID=UPI0025AD84B6|nr:uncharacterized protein LOC131025265 [Salvia miltiorrhiza]XP_057810927.1 uncharacterized protein LOC131025265 [Salvia miltiorrhiza]XP_057810928.1 uncharacterized protein LOC131025265 [Salvia miltiorrhiza]XP_057810929.1 uncharacterized protein LOC131025265 [Salvia miltiorrhiza]XP_057810930.1 uncharacterized protein LOC131025265 [Salvia miltiorrhiza]XP_057810931.1 uncharacterized protein LOC131025265 [Salvia miltiorrhiza]XP_057810932.1 uncharacterized protein LOC131025265 [Salvia miltiorrhiz